MKNTKNLFSWE